MSKNLLRVFPFLSILFLLSFSSVLYASKLATLDPLIEESFEWAEAFSPASWQTLISFDTLLIFCALGWILYTYCFPLKVWRLWRKLFVFSSVTDAVENHRTFKLAKNRFNASIPNKNNKRKLRWMHVGEAK
ncbi:MAG: hypothetical protein K2P93_07110 [Alphaproteobacteria bacterium]|nr:hypothetical protein [Alphaproteobacteria bacterium]